LTFVASWTSNPAGGNHRGSRLAGPLDGGIVALTHPVSPAVENIIQT
jgi:hypothetical protein